MIICTIIHYSLEYLFSNIDLIFRHSSRGNKIDQHTINKWMSFSSTIWQTEKTWKSTVAV